MRKVIRTSVTAGLAVCLSTGFADGLFDSGGFFVGVNYWGSQAGVHMWRAQDWNAAEIEKDVVALKAAGVEVMRVFPTWSDFQPLVMNHRWSGIPSEHLAEATDHPIYDPLWIDPGALERFRTFCDICRKHDVRLMVSLVTGWMSGRLFLPRMVENLNLVTDPVALMWEGRFVRGFVRKMKDHPAIVAWDLGNECNCMGRVESEAEAWNWLNTVSSAIRMEDPSRPVVSGMHSQTSNGTGRQDRTDNHWTLQMQGELLDVLTPHPYPAPWRVDANRGPFNGFRNALHPSSQCLFYSGVAGKPAFPQEVGSFGPTVTPDRLAAAGFRQQLFTSWMHGAPGFLIWCAFRQMNLDYAPFCNNAMERELGILDSNAERTPYPAAKVLREFKSFKESLPFKSLPPRRIEAVCLVSERAEFYHQAFGAFMLAKQAGFDVQFVGAETGALPEAQLYIVPSGDGWETYTDYAWKRILKKAEEGATVLISRGGATGYSQWESVTGLEQQMWKESRRIDFQLDGVRLFAADTYMAKQRPVACDVLATDRSGDVVISRKDRGRGRVFAVNFALEKSAVATLPNVFEGDFSNELWRIYATAAKAAGIRRIVTREDRGVVLTEHPRDDGTLIVCAVNTHAEPVDCGLSVAGRVGRVWNGAFKDGKLSIRANDGCIFEVTECGK